MWPLRRVSCEWPGRVCVVAKMRPLAGGVHASVPPAGREAPAGGRAAAASPAAAAAARTPPCESATQSLSLYPPTS